MRFTSLFLCIQLYFISYITELPTVHNINKHLGNTK